VITLLLLVVAPLASGAQQTAKVWRIGFLFLNSDITGLADAHADLVPKRLELLKQVAPSASRVAILWNPANASTRPQVKIAEAAAPALGATVIPVGVKGPRRDDVDRAFETIGKERPGSLLVVGDATLGDHRHRISALAIEHRLPTSGSHSAWAESGLLMSYGTDFVHLFRRSALLVDKILKGAKPADLPVEQPTKFELVINLKTAKALGLTVQPSLLARADRVIE